MKIYLVVEECMEYSEYVNIVYSTNSYSKAKMYKEKSYRYSIMTLEVE